MNTTKECKVQNIAYQVERESERQYENDQIRTYFIITHYFTIAHVFRVRDGFA